MGKRSFFDELIEALEAMDDAPVRRPYRNVVRHVEPQGNVAVPEEPHGGQAPLGLDAGSNLASMHGDAVSASLENTSVPEVFPSAENGGHPNDSHSNDSRSGKKLIDDPKKLVIFSEIMKPKF